MSDSSEEFRSSSVSSRDVQARERDTGAPGPAWDDLALSCVPPPPPPPPPFPAAPPGTLCCPAACRLFWPTLRPPSPPARLMVLVVSMSDSGDMEPME